MPNWKKVIVSGSDAFLNSLVVTEGITGSTAIFEGNTTTELVRITQLGTGDALRVEDTTNPDATPTVITKDGDMFIGSGSAPQSGGGNSPKLFIKNGSSGYTGNLAIDTAMLFEGNGATYFATLSPDASVSGLYFGSPSDIFGGFIRWGYDSGELRIGAASSNHKVTFTVGNKSQTSMQLIPIGGTGVPTAQLNVTGSIVVSGSTPLTAIGVSDGIGTNTVATYNTSSGVFTYSNSPVVDTLTTNNNVNVGGDLIVTGSFVSSGSITTHTTRLTAATYTASLTDYRIGVRYTQTGSVSIQLPLITDAGEIEYKFKDEEGNSKKNNITIIASGSDLIDGDVNAIMNRNYMAIGLYNDGVSNWYIE